METEPGPNLIVQVSSTFGSRTRGALLLVMGCLAILSPFFTGTIVLFLVGLLLVACGVLEMVETFHATDEAIRRSTYLGGVVSITAGILMLAQPQLVVRGLALFLAASFLIDGVGKVVAALHRRLRDQAW